MSVSDAWSSPTSCKKSIVMRWQGDWAKVRLCDKPAIGPRDEKAEDGKWLVKEVEEKERTRGQR